VTYLDTSPKDVPWQRASASEASKLDMPMWKTKGIARWQQPKKLAKSAYEENKFFRSGKSSFVRVSLDGQKPKKLAVQDLLDQEPQCSPANW